jgi:thioredoxin-like negative regulator of GroEL
MLFKNGQMVEQMVGLQSESALSAMITKAVSG